MDLDVRVRLAASASSVTFKNHTPGIKCLEDITSQRFALFRLMAVDWEYMYIIGSAGPDLGRRAEGRTEGRRADGRTDGRKDCFEAQAPFCICKIKIVFKTYANTICIF